MADQDYIKKIVEELSSKFGLAQSEVISAMMELVKGKTNTDAIAILNEINIDTIIRSKTSGILSSYVQANAGVLLGKEMLMQEGSHLEQGINVIVIHLKIKQRQDIGHADFGKRADQYQTY